jgi:beta-glucosidase
VENEVNFSAQQYHWSGDWTASATSVYSEKLEVGYRWYDAHHVRPAFPFGHGLSYTSFTYSNLKASATSISVSVTNSGDVPGAEVCQLYLGFPSAAGEPPQQLKGFVKTAVLAAGAATVVNFALRGRDLSIWDVVTHGWQEQKGAFKVGVGSSSRDIKAVGTFTHSPQAE